MKTVGGKTIATYLVFLVEVFLLTFAAIHKIETHSICTTLMLEMG